MSRKRRLRLFFLNCGYGDAIIIEFPDQSIGIIDGNWKCMSIKSLPKHYRKIMNSDSLIRFICLSHPHKDHFNGLHLILQGLGERVQEFWHSGGAYFKDSLHHRQEVADSKKGFEKAVGDLIQLYRVRDDLMEKGLRNRNVSEGMELGCFGSVHVNAIGPSTSEWRKYLCEIGKYRLGTRAKEADHNLISSVLHLEYGESSILLTADAPRMLLEWHALKPLPSGVSRPSYAVVKIPHHGSSYSHCIELFTECMAKDRNIVAVISGRRQDEMEQHCSSVLNDIRSSGVEKILYTFKDDDADIELAEIPPEVCSVLAIETGQYRDSIGSSRVVVDLSEDGTIQTKSE